MATPANQADKQSGTVRMLRIKYSKSAIGYKRDQKDTIAALGFRKLGQTLEVKDTPAIRGMIRKVRHLVTVEENQN